MKCEAGRRGEGKLAKGFALDIPAGYGSQGSLEAEDRMAVVCALRSRLTSSNEAVSPWVSA